MQSEKEQKIIEQIVPPPELSAEEKKRTFELFTDNLDLIFRYADTIIQTPQLFHCPLGGARIELAYAGEYHPPLGALMHLWQNGTLVETCGHCQGDWCVYRAAVSPLSGANQGTGICRTCRTVARQDLPSFMPVMSAIKYIRANLNKRKVLRPKGSAPAAPDESNGASASEQIVKKEVVPVSMDVLVRRLKKYDERGALTPDEKVPSPENADNLRNP